MAEDATVPTAKDFSEDKSQDKKAEEKPDPVKLLADAAELNKKISAWTYIISKWKAGRLITDREDFFEKPRPEEKAEDGMPKPGMTGMAACPCHAYRLFRKACLAQTSVNLKFQHDIK